MTNEHAKAMNEARTAKLSPAERSAISKKAAEARWGADRHPRATHEGVLEIGDLQLQCAVLENGKRVLSQRGVGRALGRQKGGRLGGGDQIPFFLAGDNLKPFISDDLRAVIMQPIRYRIAGGGIGFGVEATALPRICEVWLKARDAGALQTEAQKRVTAQADILMRGFALVGIIALVDEATGYQKDRARDALAHILEKFIAKELRPWVRTFPPEFYEHMFRLRGWPYDPASVKRPMAVAKYTTDIAYQRLAPGVLEELKRLTPRDDKGRLKHHLHRRLTEEVGAQKLKEHLIGTVALMRASDTWPDFKRKLDRVYPRFGDNLLLPFKDENGDAAD